MEEKKLLRFLTLIIFNLIINISYAEDIFKNDNQMFLNNFKDMMKLDGFDPSLGNSVLKPRPILQIFVSKSMPKQLLRAYAKEASRYDGVLVFRGLPEGSFRQLIALVMDISDASFPCAMQIDDEAFKAYDIKAVPTIVLSKPASIFDEQREISNFDKLQGNITIKYALELFSSGGDLASLARGMLK